MLASAAVVLGASGAFGRPGTTTVTRRAVTALDCPWKDPAATLPAGSRVLAVASAEGGWIGVRNPAALDQVVWLHTSELRAEPGEDRLESLPGLSCNDEPPAARPAPEVTTTQPAAAPELAAPAPTPAPSTGASTTAPAGPGTAPPGQNVAPSTTSAPAAPGPTSVARDTTPPVISQAGVAPVEICDVPQTGWSNSSNITALASDDRGVTSVVATFSGSVAPPLTLSSRPNRTYLGTFTPSSATARPNAFVDVTITLTARDAANNTATTTLRPVRVYDAGLCLF